MDTGGARPSVPRMETLTAMPARFTAGETLSYTRTVSGLPDSTHGWVLFVYLAGAAQPLAAGPFTIAADGSCTVTVDANITHNLAAGNYRWQETAKENVASYAGKIVTWDRGSVIVDLDLAQATGGSAQSFEARVLAALQAKILGRITTDAETIQIDGTTIARIPFELAERLVSKYQALVEAQNNPGALMGSVEVNFGPPGLPIVPGFPLPNQYGGRS